MNIQFPVQQCQYCGSMNIGLSWQHGEALVTLKEHGLRDNRLQCLICRRRGAVLYQCAAKPHRSPAAK